MDGDDVVQPYWSGGPFRVTIECPPGAFSTAALAKAVAVLEEFRAECQKAYFAFNGTVNGRLDASNKYKRVATTRAALFSVGSAFPDAQQRPGLSTIATLTQGELLDALAEGGDFEDRQNRAVGRKNLIRAVKRRANHLRANRSSVAYTVCITGLLDSADGFFAPYRAANRPTAKPNDSFAAWLWRIRCGDSAEFRRNWRALAFGSARERSLNTCDGTRAEHLLRDGGSSWPRTASRSGRAISSRFRLFGFARFSSSSSSTTVLDRLCTHGSPRIRTRTGWPSRWSKLAGQIRQRPVS